MSLEELATAQLPPEDIPEMVTDAQIAEKEHVNRLWEQEEDLNTVIFQNRDGSKTLYYFDYAVKYVDENGVVRDKKNLLSGDIAEPSLVEDYGYVNADNDIQTYFPKTLDRDNGVVLTYGEYRIEMAPMHRVKAPLMVAAGLQVAVRPGEQQTSGLREIMLEAQTAPAVKKQTDTGQTTERPSDVVEYAGIFGEGTLLRYTPTFEGYKEDLILAGPEAGNRFTFVVDAGGLQVVSENQAVYFLNPLTGEILATMDPLYVYDSFVGDSPHTTYGNGLLCTRLEDGTYEITMVVDEAFLNDPATVYPVVVDPSVRAISSGSIVDASIYSGYGYNITPGSAESQTLKVGWSGLYGIGRALLYECGKQTGAVLTAPVCFMEKLVIA